jgi:hypothetical protein
MIPSVTDESVHRLVEQAEAHRIDRPTPRCARRYSTTAP